MAELQKVKNFIGQSYTSPNPQFDCSRTVNWYPMVDENQTAVNNQISQLQPTPGLTVSLSSPVAGFSVRGGFTSSTGVSFFVAGATLYRLQGSFAPYTPVAVGTLNSQRGRVHFADNGTTMCMVDGPYGYFIDLPTLGFTQITDPAFYGSNFVEFYDGYFVFAKPFTTLFYWSDPFATTFNALNFASKSGNADPIAGIAVIQRQLWLIGTQTSEIWTDVGGTVTFQRLQGPYIEMGCAAPQSICKSDSGSLFWITDSIRGGASVAMTNGNAPQKVSTFGVDYALQQYGQYILNATAYCYQQYGSLFYVINPPNGTSSWVYDATTSLVLGLPTWHERTYTVPPSESTLAVPNGTQKRHLADVAWFYNGAILVGAYDRPMVYVLDMTNGTDNGAAIFRQRTAPHIARNFDRVFYEQFRLLCQTGSAGYIDIATTETSNANVADLVLTVGNDSGVGGCTHLGFSHSPSWGALTNANSIPNTTIVQIGAILGDLGFQYDNFAISIRNNTDASNTVAPASNVWEVLVFTDQNGNVEQYQSGVATITTSGNVKTWTMATGLPATPLPFTLGDSYPMSLTYGGGEIINVTQSVSEEPMIGLSWSDNGAYNWSPEIFESAGQVGQYGELVEWWRLGEGRNRAFRISYSGATPIALMDAAAAISVTDD